MGQQPGTWIDTASLRSVAHHFDVSAQALDDTARRYLTGLVFGGVHAGRAHVARGEAVRAALGRLAGDLTQWSRAAGEIAVTLRTGVDGYVDAELRAAARIG